MALYRSIIECDRFTRAIERIAQKYPRVREVVDALSWRLPRDAETHYQIPGTDRHIVKTVSDDYAPDIPMIRVLYRFDDEKVYLLDAVEVEYRVSDE